MALLLQNQERLLCSIANLHIGCAINVHVLFMLHHIATYCVCSSNGSRGLAVAEMRPKIKECGSQRYFLFLFLFCFFQDREAYRDKLILGHYRRLQGNLTNSELCSVNKLWGQKGLNIESVARVRQSPPVYFSGYSLPTNYLYISKVYSVTVMVYMPIHTLL